MSRRRSKPILLLKQAHDPKFPTKLKNKHVTRFGNPATPLGARYFVSDPEGLRLTAVDLEYLRLYVDEVPVTAIMARRIQDRVKREQMLLGRRLAAQGVPRKIRALLELNRIADVQKYLAKQKITEYELFLFIYNCKQIGWRHRSKFPEYVPNHLQVTEQDRRDLHDGKLEPFSKKIGASSTERRRIHVHLFQRQSMCHCFYFSYEDLQNGAAAHWEHGPHAHYVSSLWPKYGSRDAIWSLFDTRRTKVSGDIHVRFSPFEYSSSGIRGTVSPFSPHFGFQPMLIALDSRNRSSPNRDPIPTAQVATRGFWTFDISRPNTA